MVISLIRNLRSKCILVLDDENDLVFTFKRSLEYSGFPVYGFTDPRLLLEHFSNNSNHYALVLTDVGMPIMEGLEFAARIRKLSQRVRSLLMCAFEMKDLDVESPLEISELLQKPHSLHELGEIVSKHVDARY